MKIIKNYDNYVTDLIFESLKDGKDLHFSKDFLSLLDKIDHPISKKLKDSHEKQNANSTLIDLDDSGVDKVSWIEPGRNRTTGKIGTLIKKILGDKFPSSGTRGEDSLESFINMFKAFKDDDSYFDVVKGSDIEKYYDESNYAGRGGSLGSSDMARIDNQESIKFYSKHRKQISMVVLFNNDDEVLGRALLWKLNKPTDRWFMDRIYTARKEYEQKFIEHAKHQGWLYLEEQTFRSSDICDPKTGKCDDKDMVVKGINTHSKYPFMDTFKYFLVTDGILTNKKPGSDEKYFILNRTDGGYEDTYTDE